jgi:DNA invertase Pin-like site-specific DNA recombinase
MYSMMRVANNLGLPENAVLVGYARVSTHDQNPDLQVDALKAAGCVRVYVETASGAAAERPELKAAIEGAKPGDVIAVWKLDRLGRSLLQMIETVHRLDARGIGFVSLTENIDTTTSTGRLVLHIFGAIAEFERSMIIERTQAGLAAARSRGRVGGRPRKMTAEALAMAEALASEEGVPMADIAARIGVSVSTLYAYVQDRRGKRKAG